MGWKGSGFRVSGFGLAWPREAHKRHIHVISIWAIVELYTPGLPCSVRLAISVVAGPPLPPPPPVAPLPPPGGEAPPLPAELAPPPPPATGSRARTAAEWRSNSCRDRRSTIDALSAGHCRLILQFGILAMCLLYSRTGINMFHWSVLGSLAPMALIVDDALIIEWRWKKKTKQILAMNWLFG